MRLSLSVRIAESATKDRMTMPFDAFARLAKRTGYPAVCMRASAGGVQSSREQLVGMRTLLDELDLAVSMVTTDFNVPLNNDDGPNNLRDFEPHLDVADSFGADLIRVCMKTEEDIPWAQRAADQAAERNIRIAHQCHTNSLFETVAQDIDILERIGRDNFGIIYEPGNLLLLEQSYGLDTLGRLAPYLMNVYLQNHRVAADGPESLYSRTRGTVRYDSLPLWEIGGVDFKEVFDSLQAIGYHGSVTVHQEYAKLMGPQDAAKKSYDYLSNQIQ